MSDPCTPLLQLNPDEVVVLPQTHKNKCTKLGCQSLLRGCRRAGEVTGSVSLHVGVRREAELHYYS